MSVPKGDSTTVPSTFADIQGKITSAQAPSAISSPPPLNDSSNMIATTSWVRGQGFGGPVNVSFADAEIPGGAIDGVNQVFTLFTIPNPIQSLQIFYNGSLLSSDKYALNTNMITLNFAPNPPIPPDEGDTLVTYYRH